MDPLVFEPYARPQVWGGRRLETSLGKRLPSGGTFGESWEISAHPHHVSRVAEGSLAGKTLDDLWRERSREIFGGQGAAPTKFPLLVKYLDCREQLSVQVHPSDEIAAALRPGEAGKTEAWVVLEADATARIYAGLRPGTTRQQLEAHLAQGTVSECLHSFVPKPGDCLFLPAGTVHAVGGGVLMAEVQQSSDATFRLFDWNRPGSDGQPRQLHIDESLQSIDWTAGPADPVTPQPIDGLPSGVEGERLVECRYFSLTRYRITAGLRLPSNDHLSIWLVLDGLATLERPGSDYARLFRQGASVLIPARSDSLRWQPRSGATATLLHVAIPG